MSKLELTSEATKELTELLRLHQPNNVVRSLQPYLGYDSSTHIPDIIEFIESDFYLGKSTDNGRGIYKYWKDTLVDIYPNPLYTNYDTIFLRNAIGCGKSTVAQIMTLYNMTKMILMEDPHKFFGILPNKDLIVFLYALQEKTINGAMYGPLLEFINKSKFFRSNMMMSKGYKFKNKVVINTGSTIARNVGLDIFHAWMDEIQQERLKSQSLDNYNSLKARVKSRFMLDGGVFFNSQMVLSGLIWWTSIKKLNCKNSNFRTICIQAN